MTATAQKWWQDGEVYEIYTSSFCDSNGDGTGDLRGILSRLDHLQQLGIDAVWLTPVYASPMVDNGYDVSDYRAINPLYGSMEDMEELIRAAGERGIRIVMDLVINHTSDRHRWFTESCQGKDNPCSDYYIWRDAGPDGAVPNNWRSIFGGSAWTWNERRGQYYLHTFAAAQPDLNWANPAVRREILEIANFWLDKGVGGFRIDAVPYIKKPSALADGLPDNADGTVSIHSMTANTEGILDYLREFNNGLRRREEIFTVGEANGVEASSLKDWVGTDGVFDMLIQFTHLADTDTWYLASAPDLAGLRKALNDSQAATASNGWYPIFFENHDKPRSVNVYFGADCDPDLSARTLGTILYTLRGTPFLYQGQEIGMRNTTWSMEEWNDVSIRGQYDLALANHYTPEEAMGFVNFCTRDNARTPMQWSAAPQAGFTSGTPWLKVNPDYRTVNVEAQASDPHSVLSWYRTLAALRSRSEILRRGDYIPLLTEHPQILAFRRSYQGAGLTVFANMTASPAVLSPDQTRGLTLLLTSREDCRDPDHLAPLEARIYSDRESI